MMEPFQLVNESYYLIKDWQIKDPSLVAGFTTRFGGVSGKPFDELNMGFHVGDQVEDVRINRKRLANSISFPIDEWIGAEQTHKHHIQYVTSLHKGRGALQYEDSLLDTDGLYTDESNLFLTLCYADCVPIYFLSFEKKKIGIVHAGWKGTVLGIAAELVKIWKNLGIHEDEIHVVIGPSICGNCYIVDDRVINQVKKRLSPSQELPFTMKETGQYYLDLKRMNELILREAGIPKLQIRTSKLCTSCDHRFFSHRRDHGKTGRMIGFIGWKENGNGGKGSK
ncbi:YfiH family protein [Oikeobacillus pervagus]|uniref:Purine nucleoside phosphorylase n=1 Tax=Oikeobacillus pervagus TaxID=1325931 RepID=A0AAJ1T4G4_9BACI|nr:peptidoglycan editing factor PgeF [Oikeobacillus pervagus]MDQ0215046.1 YfiH family protein [Oikeobacillus pervagus]